MGRLRNKLSALSLGLVSLLVQACSGLGYQGGVIPTNFSGIITAQAVSPQTIELDWNVFPGATKYNVYSPDTNVALYTPTLNKILFKPIPNDPTLTYQYAVTAVDPLTGNEQGSRSQYSSVQLLPHFNFKNSGAMTAVNKTSLRVSWTGNSNVNYSVYVAERLPTGIVNYNNFVASAATVIGQSSVVIPNLLEGREYCAVAVAKYSDNTSDGPDGVLFNADIDIGTRLNSALYSVGPSGNFGDSIVAKSQKCARTVSDFNVANIKIYAPKATLSNRPIFYVSVPGDVTEDTNGTVTTTIYQANETTGLASLVGSRNGTGKIIAQSSLDTGRYKFFAVINDLSGSNAQAKTEILVAPNYALPATELDRKYVYVRSFNATESTTAPSGYFPEKQQGGYGSQQAGSAVAVGDFNCDGKMDVAVGIPQASIVASDARPAKQGKVVIYFDVNSSSPGAVSPSPTPRSQTITFDISSLGGNDNSRDLMLGTSLYVGNFNNDNQQTNQPVMGVSSGLNANFKCDDLAIGSGYGPMFVLYGKRDVSGFDGGLNFIGPTSFAQNPSASCDPHTNVCQPAIYTQGAQSTYPVGAVATSGDYNGDGYEDLATSSLYTGVWVFRGSEYGLIAPSPFTAESIATTSGPYLNFPFIPRDPNNFASPAPAPSTGWGTQAFGTSISTLHNAYYDINSANGTKGSKRIRDVILVGNPITGVAHACLPTSDYTLPDNQYGTIGSSNDVNTGLYWDCSKSILGPSGDKIGSAMADIKNALRYRPDQFTTTNCVAGFGNCSASSINLGYPGAVAISSVTTNTVYAYYLVNNPTAFTPASPATASDRDTLGWNRNNYLLQLFGNASSPVTASLAAAPCTVSGSGENCLVQKIKHPNTNLVSFGMRMKALPGNVTVAADQSKDTLLAVASPLQNFVLSNGNTYNEVGTVQLFSQNTRGANNPIVVKGTNACDSVSICRYSDGFSNSLTTALDYDGVLSDNVHFGLGGIAGGPLVPTVDLSNYSINSDIVVGAPGHVARISDSGNNYSVIDNGGAFTYFSQAGVYRNYRIADTSGPTPWHVMDQSFSQESDMKFHEAVSIGDINQDGISEVAVRINQGSRNSIRIYNGLSSKVGLDKNTGGYTNLQVQGDASGGIRMAPLGKITNTNLQGFFITSDRASYLYFAGIGGIVQAFPSAFAVGGIPRKLYAPVGTTSDPGFPSKPIYYLNFANQFIYNAETPGVIDSTLSAYSSFTHGDFNGDGFEDFAIGFNTSGSIANLTGVSATCASTNGYCGTEGAGRVMVFYGGTDNGLQTQPDSNGGYPMSSSYFTDYSSDASVGKTNLGAPCTTNGAACKIQMLHEPATSTYGSSLTAVPLGTCTDANSVQHPVSGLAITASLSSGNRIFIYRPKCLDPSAATNLSGLVAYNDTSGTGPIATNSYLPIPLDSSNSLGASMTAVTKLMGTAPVAPASSLLTSHLVVTDPSNSRVLVYPVHKLDSNKESFETYDTTNATALNDGARKIDYASSSMMSGSNGTNSMFGSGIASVGDINGDSYSDIAIAISKLTRRDTATQSLSQGAVLMLFGGAQGVQSHSNPAQTSLIEPARVSSCYIQTVGAIPTSVCNPTLLFTPQAANSARDGAFERTFISPFAAVDTSSSTNPGPNDGLGSFLIGIPAKDSLEDLPNKRILQGGAFYELP